MFQNDHATWYTKPQHFLFYRMNNIIYLVSLVISLYQPTDSNKQCAVYEVKRNKIAWNSAVLSFFVHKTMQVRLWLAPGPQFKVTIMGLEFGTHTHQNHTQAHVLWFKYISFDRWQTKSIAWRNVRWTASVSDSTSRGERWALPDSVSSSMKITRPPPVPTSRARSITIIQWVYKG